MSIMLHVLKQGTISDHYGHLGRFRLDKKCFHCKDGQALEQVSQGSGRITILEAFKRCVDVAFSALVYW